MTATPTEHNPDHVSVYYGEIDSATPESVARAIECWADPNRVTLDELAVPAGEAL